MKEKFHSYLRTESGTEIEKTLRQQLGALLPALLKSGIQALPDVARADRIRLLGKKKGQLIEKVDSMVISLLLSDSRVSIEKGMPGQVQTLFDSRLPDISVLKNTVRPQMERVLPLHRQPSSYKTESGYSLKNTLQVPEQEPDGAKLASPFKVYPTGTRKKTRIRNKSVAKVRTVDLLASPGNKTDFK